MNEKILKDFSKYISFNILGQIAYSCYTLANTFFVSADIGTKGLTALNLAVPVFCLISGVGPMIGIGSSTRFSILKSRNESSSANQVFNTTNIYLKTLMMFAPAFMLNHLLQCFVRNDGYPSLSMAAMMTGSFWCDYGDFTCRNLTICWFITRNAAFY